MLSRYRFLSSYVPAKARAMVFEKYGNPKDVLRAHTYELPPLTPTTLHMRFLASPINPADINQIEGVYPARPTFTKELGGLPDGEHKELAVGGNEGVAEIIAVGDQVKDLKVGDWVIMGRAGFGTWRTHAAATPNDVIHFNSKEIGLIQAATLSVNPCTAYRMLKDFVTLKKGDFVIQCGANSSVGQSVIQIAKAWDVNTINIVRNRPDIENLKTYLKSLGATHIITDQELRSYKTKELIKEWTGGNVVKLGLNCVGGEVATEMAKYLGQSGVYVTYGAMSRQPFVVPASHLIFKDIKFLGFWMSRWNKTHSREEKEEMLNEVITLMKFKKETPGYAAFEEVLWGNPSESNESLRDKFLDALDKSGAGFHGKKQILKMQY
ncbi:putative enoyl reductase (ER), mitochondrial [Rhizophagus clarus]|uniref:enoyl-[acyl-carrier-protein] reductase n=1 Tax=Rhizophagus clarus TaxID=94130 RepID=A0A2Z6QVG5_9GLOM|nr:putative enoyl reductase (ER), mitochondrial [Rhizophagus clarus]GES86101.1 NAD(P)-binding protein [Rhizophagus clarus]